MPLLVARSLTVVAYVPVAWLVFAIEYTGRGPRVTPRLLAVALLVVADPDSDVPPQERTVLVEGRETPLERGSGIGLWLVNWIVSESMGTVSFGENHPTGSVVTLRLPLADEHEV